MHHLIPGFLEPLTPSCTGCEELAVEGSLTGDREKVYYAIYFDPLTSAVLSLEEIKKMVDEMFEKNKDHLPQFK